MSYIALTNVSFNIDMDKVLADHKAKLLRPIKGGGKIGTYTTSITVRVNLQSSALWMLTFGLITWREYIEFVYPQAKRAGEN